MKDAADRMRIATYYDRLVDRYGHDPRACDASSWNSLEVRYRCLSALTDLSGKSVLEVGCGFGDLGRYLVERHPGVRYSGIDLSGRMVEEGRRSRPELDLKVADVMDLPGEGVYDVLLAQGIFYLLGQCAEEKMRRIVTRMFALAREAVAFTTLSTWTPHREEGEYYADPIDTARWCRSLTPALTLRHDYHPGDFTMYLYRTGP